MYQSETQTKVLMKANILRRCTDFAAGASYIYIDKTDKQAQGVFLLSP